jgi:hypothetical protein
VNTILAAASEVMTWLSEHKWPACVIGGLAVQRWGEPRLTAEDPDLGRPFEAALKAARLD